MKFMGLSQVAVAVEDLDAAVKDFTDVFGIEFAIVQNEDIKLRVAVSDSGVVLAARTDGDVVSPLEQCWNGPLTAVELRVDDVEEARKRLEDRGCLPVYYMDAPGGLIEYYMHQFHGVPLTIFQAQGESWVDSIGEGIDDAANYNPQIRWIDKNVMG